MSTFSPTRNTPEPLLVLSTLADGISRRVEDASAVISGALFEPVIRLGVTGLVRSGKTVFITSLVGNLLERGRMPGLAGVADGRIEAAFLQPQPDNTVPRFDYENHLAALTGPQPSWPDSTRAVSELRLSFKVRPSGVMGVVQGPRRIHVDIVDYPGEWLLDLALLDKSYTDWSGDVLARLAPRSEAAEFLAMQQGVEPTASYDETQAKALAQSYAKYLADARLSGFHDCTPGRFLLPGDLAGSPVLTFAPLPVAASAARRGSLWREMERRFEAYKAEVVKPFFRHHFSRIDRQVVLVDVLDAIHNGPAAVEDMRIALADILGAFRPGRNAWLSRILGTRRVERILFAATKADHLHHSQHQRLENITEALVRDARDRARFAGAVTQSMAIASLRATTEETRQHAGKMFECVRGRLLDTGRQAAFYPGDLPEDPSALLAPAREGALTWLDRDYEIMRFAPAPLTLRAGEGPPHIRLDKAADFLIGDRL